MAQQFEQQNIIDALLTRAMGPVRRVLEVFVVRENGKIRVLEEKRDNTDISPDGGVETIVSREAHFHGCQHFANGNLGGQCECGATVCVNCIILCSACGAATCPKHRAADPEDPRLFYCPTCAAEIGRARRIRRTVGVIASFFLERETK